jgi:hypothetical protein
MKASMRYSQIYIVFPEKVDQQWCKISYSEHTKNTTNECHKIKSHVI